MSSHIFPGLGAYIAFTIDAVATIGETYDPILRKAARSMKQKIYVGFVCERKCASSFARWHSVDLRLLGQGLGETDEEQCIIPSMCFPVLPETYHPNGREPITPSNPLPWKNCYHYTYYTTVTIRFQPRKSTSPPQAQLTIPQIVEYNMRNSADVQSLMRRQRPQTTRQKAEDTELEAETGQGPLWPEEWDVSDFGSVDCEEHYARLHAAQQDQESIESQLDGMDDGSINGPLDADHRNEDEVDAWSLPDLYVGYDEPNVSIPVVKATYELSRINGKKIAGPDEFYKDIAALKQMVKEAKQREIERARKIDEHAFRALERNGKTSNNTRSKLLMRSYGGLGAGFRRVCHNTKVVTSRLLKHLAWTSPSRSGILSITSWKKFNSSSR
ncbi:hypothetical protein AX16_006361 [Volvariella volvacea WC 439]|nr:hypothetical protein AX16_006361 [Volvariella volvacea WC 439]